MKKSAIGISIAVGVLNLALAIIAMVTESIAWDLSFKITVSISIALSITINYINNSFNTTMIINKNYSKINEAINKCFLINIVIQACLDALEGRRREANLEKYINENFEKCFVYSDEVESQIIGYMTDATITLNDSARLKNINNYIKYVRQIKDYCPFSNINAQAITERNNKMKNHLRTLIDIYKSLSKPEV